MYFSGDMKRWQRISLPSKATDDVQVVFHLVPTACLHRAPNWMGEEELPPVGSIPHPTRDTPQPGKECGIQRVGKHHRQIEALTPNLTGEPLATSDPSMDSPRLILDDSVHRRLPLEEAGQPGPRQDGHLRPGVETIQRFQRRQGKNGIPDPIHLTHEDLSDAMRVDAEHARLAGRLIAHRWRPLPPPGLSVALPASDRSGARSS